MEKSLRKSLSILSVAYAVALFGSIAAISTLSTGCSGVVEFVKERPTTARLAVNYATFKVIDGDADRADRVASIARTIRKAAEGETASTVSALEELARDQIDWERLDAADTILVELLIVEIREELTRRLDGDLIPPDSRVTVSTVFAWIESAAETAPVVSAPPEAPTF